ncbi:MAG: hypothetical protein RIQ97_2889 [Pseudomonadota bacterium]|jgi:cation transport protein ChaC
MSGDGAALLARVQREAAALPQLWVFAYASLIWRPEFEVAEQHRAHVLGWHRALRMWSRINRGSFEQPGLVFALLPGGSCQGLVCRVPDDDRAQVLERLWAREMPMAVYTPRWLRCRTPQGTVPALAFTLARSHPSHTGELSAHQLQHIFRHAQGRFGSTLDYARQTHQALRAHGIEDHALARMLRHAPQPAQ